ncbi:MAG: beta-lactamase family protein, partial [Actinobacteria bacterium]|nr:beta-lactamase family protein [Actinomycetota bacterium]
REGPVVGMPPVEDAAAGWAATWMDPDYWVDYARDAVEDGHLNMPYPTDPVKPEAYLPNVPVPDGDDVSRLPVEHVDLSELTYEFDGETKTIEQFVATTRTDGVVLVHDGTVVGEWYANGYAPDVRHQPWSVTKTFVAAVVGIAFDDGLIDSLRDPIDAYIPDLAGTAWEGVTIENLLQMESGVHWDEGTPVLVVNTQVEQWVQLGLDLYTEGQLGQTRNEFLASLPPAYEQGTEFRYNSGNTQVLAWLTEVLYDATFNEILSQKLWQPMGAAESAVMTSDRVGGVVASHGLFAIPYDLARFGEVLRNGGRTPEGHQVVPDWWVEAMTTMTDVSDGQYGYQTWAHPTAGEGAYSASGFQGQKITVVPDACLTGVRTAYALGADIRDGEPSDPAAYGFATEFNGEEWETLLAAVAAELGGCSAASPGGDPVAGAPAGDDTVGGRAGGLPATGGGAAGTGVAVLALAAALRRGRGGPPPA